MFTVRHFPRPAHYLPIVAAVLAIVVLVPGDDSVRQAADVPGSKDEAAIRPSYLAGVQASADGLDAANVLPANAGAAAPKASSAVAALATVENKASLSVVSTPATPMTPEAADNLVRVGDSAVNVRAGPTKSSAKLFVLQPGEAVRIGETNRGWVRIVRADGESGWVYSSYLDDQGAAAPKTNASQPAAAAEPEKQVAVAKKADEEERPQAMRGKFARLGAAVVVRAGPSRTAARLFVLDAGERVAIAEVRGAWIRVVLPSGVSGWVRAR